MQLRHLLLSILSATSFSYSYECSAIPAPCAAGGVKSSSCDGISPHSHCENRTGSATVVFECVGNCVIPTTQTTVSGPNACAWTGGKCVPKVGTVKPTGCKAKTTGMEPDVDATVDTTVEPTVDPTVDPTVSAP